MNAKRKIEQRGVPILEGIKPIVNTHAHILPLLQSAQVAIKGREAKIVPMIPVAIMWRNEISELTAETTNGHPKPHPIFLLLVERKLRCWLLGRQPKGSKKQVTDHRQTLHATKVMHSISGLGAGNGNPTDRTRTPIRLRFH